jgi:hypothetical protein
VERVRSDAVELRVDMSDGQRHLYRRTSDVRDSDGGRVVVFDWVGRRFGPS